MRVHVSAVGRLRPGPERSLIDDYAKRFDRSGRAQSLGPLSFHEVDERKGGGMAGEAALLERSLPAGALLCVLDERGKMMTSPQFARRIADWRDAGTQDLAFVIGGADGLDAALRDRATAALSLGTMVWPHKLARVMLCEQLYRAASILAGAPYHRD